MLSTELATSVQESYKLIVILLDNHGFKSIGALSRSLGQGGFGTRFIHRKDGILAGDSAGDAVEPLAIDFAANARSLGAIAVQCHTLDEFTCALEDAKKTDRTTVICIENDRLISVPGYESWWDVPVAEVSPLSSVQEARKAWEEMRAKEKYFL